MPGRVGHFPQKNLHLLLSILRKSRNNMNATTINSSPLNDSPVISTSHDAVCKHHTRNGRCRLPVADPLTALCAEHARRQRMQDKAASLSAELIAGLTEFKSAAPINDFLARLLIFQAQDRIPPRRAAVMAYTCNLLLRTLPAIAQETAPPAEKEHRIIIDMPGPDREWPDPKPPTTNHAPPSHPVMTWLEPSTGAPNSEESSSLP